MGTILVGLAGDNAIQFIFRNKGLQKDVKFFQTASVLVTFCMIILSSSFFFSSFQSLRDLGILMIIGFVLNFIGDIYILKSLAKR